MPTSTELNRFDNEDHTVGLLTNIKQTREKVYGKNNINLGRLAIGHFLIQ